MASKNAKEIVMESMKKDHANLKKTQLRSMAFSDIKPTKAQIVRTADGRTMNELAYCQEILAESQEQLDRIQAERIARSEARMKRYAAGGPLVQ